MRTLLRQAGLLALSGFLSVGIAQAVLIDDFDTTQQHVDRTSPGPLNALATGAIGGSRTMELTGITGPLSAAGDVIAPAPGILSHSNDALTRSMLLVTWDNNGAGLGGADLTAGGASHIQLDILSIDIGGVNLELFITDTGGDLASLLISGAGVGAQNFSYASFTNFANVDFASVNKIQLKVTALRDAADLTMDFIETVVPNNPVPEPGTLLMMGTGLVGVGVMSFVRRRRQQKP